MLIFHCLNHLYFYFELYNSKNYHFIHAITVDTQFIMKNANKNSKDLRKELIDFLDNNIKIKRNRQFSCIFQK